MGCGSSNAVKTVTGSSLTDRPSSAPLAAVERVKRTITSALSRPGSGRKALSADLKSRASQLTDNADKPDFRGGSANSERSVDSGIGGENHYAVISKSTEENSISTINKQPSLLTNSQQDDDGKPRPDEGKVLDSLRAEGLLGPSANASKGGLTFEVSFLRRGV